MKLYNKIMYSGYIMEYNKIVMMIIIIILTFLEQHLSVDISKMYFVLFQF